MVRNPLSVLAQVPGNESGGEKVDLSSAADGIADLLLAAAEVDPTAEQSAPCGRHGRRPEPCDKHLRWQKAQKMVHDPLFQTGFSILPCVCSPLRSHLPCIRVGWEVDGPPVMLDTPVATVAVQKVTDVAGAQVPVPGGGSISFPKIDMGGGGEIKVVAFKVRTLQHTFL